MKLFVYTFSILFLLLQSSCSNKEGPEYVSVKDFEEFVRETSYITDAEKYGWSVVQKTVYKFDIVDGATWRMPDGITTASSEMPVTQVSYNDAIAYCKWNNSRLPSYLEFWDLTASDKRSININNSNILPASETNFIGNTWDITTTQNDKDEIRLVGGSYLCHKSTCDGTNPNRELFVSKDTGNSNISFCVLRD